VPAHPMAPAAAPAAPAAAAAAATAVPAWVSAAPELRQKALALLAGPLAGDELAAEYLLLACLSSVRVGVDTVIARQGCVCVKEHECVCWGGGGGKAAEASVLGLC
jgi:hypothetical protein